MRRTGIVFLFVSAFALLELNAQAQQLRVELALTTEKSGASVNIDANYYNSRYRILAVGRLFVDELESESFRTKKNPLAFEALAGPVFRHGTHVIAPMGGVDSKKRVIVGANYVTRIFQHTTGYLGYIKLASASDEVNSSRHRVLFDFRKDQKIFVRLDWKTIANENEHLRMGAEFHTRIDKLNLPVYVEPFWDFSHKYVGVRLGTRL